MDLIIIIEYIYIRGVDKVGDTANLSVIKKKTHLTLLTSFFF